MYKGLKISAPFFEIGPKAYLYGEKMLALAKVIDKVATKYDVDVIVTPQYTDISLLAHNTERISVFA
ncbi:MAG TPA: triose-phosphate isomerase, partial [Clostridia bacterium]|nr:triose-phosphate isomerase [Clostridia bacterium]